MLAGDAAAKSFSLPAADVVVQVGTDGSLIVDEVIAFAFDGDFSGAYREIPLRDGETLDQVAVSEEDVQYRPGASAELGSTGEPGTFGTTETDKGVRIVWHFRANSETRSFRIHYRLRGVAVAYDDVVDVNVQVWGDEWEVGLGQLTAAVVAPADILRAWGHPVGVRGDVTLDGRRANLRAIEIPARPIRRAPRSDPAPRVHLDGGYAGRTRPGLERIVAEERDDAAAYERDQRKIDEALDNLPRTLATLLALALGPALALLAFVWWRFGREHKTAYDREYEQEPPTETAARARAVAARPGRDAGIARVHRDAVRPDPPRALPLRAGHDRAEDLGRPQDPAGLGSRALARRRGGARRGVRGAGRPGGRRDPRRGPGAALALPRPDRGGPEGELGALHGVQVGGRD